ncbi:hypothetical protein D3C87_841540 [compost metagenome]
MRHQHGKAQNLARPLPAAEFLRVQQFVDRHEVTLGLRHLAAFHLHEAVMHPHIGHDMRAVGAARLRDFVLMMREDEVEPAAVNIENFTEIATGHGRAFDVPARTTATPGAFPARFIIRGQFPQHEIAGGLLVGFHRHARARLLFVQRPLGKLAVIRHRPGVEQHFAASRIGMATRDQPFDEVDHFRDIVSGARFDGRRKATERGHILMELVGGLFRHRMDGVVQRQMRIIPQRPRVDLVIEIGDVAGIGHMVFAKDVAQQPVENIEHDDRAGIADMGKIIDGRTADIHAHIVSVDRRKFRFFACECIVKFQAQGHAAVP